jgi:hypothetical protein
METRVFQELKSCVYWMRMCWIEIDRSLFARASFLNLGIVGERLVQLCLQLMQRVDITMDDAPFSRSKLLLAMVFTSAPGHRLLAGP